MKTIKIMRIIARLNIGGPAINAILLTEGLSKEFESVLVTGQIGSQEGDISYLAHEEKIFPVVIEGLGRDIRWLGDIMGLWKIFYLIKKEKPCIVHTHTAKAGTLGRCAAILAGVPVKVHTFHGHIFNSYFSPAKTKCFIWIERFLARFTDRVIAVGERVKEELCNKYKIAPADKVKVIRLGFDLEKFLKCEKHKGKLRYELNIIQYCYLVGIVGRLVPIKGHKMFLDAARELKIRNEELKIKFIIVGDGELRRELEEYAKAIGLADDVIFLGWRRDLDVIYADLDIVCLTSLNEGTPVSLIEAQASGKPVVATDVGGTRDIVVDGNTAILVKSEDSEGFAKVIEELLNNEQKRIDFGMRGREIVKDKFSKDKLINNMEDLYNKLLQEKGIA